MRDYKTNKYEDNGKTIIPSILALFFLSLIVWFMLAAIAGPAIDGQDAVESESTKALAGGMRGG